MERQPSETSDSSPTESFRPLIDDAIVITGPTAAGKTDVAIDLAQRLGAEILSIDSIAVYRGMDIGTAKPSAAHRQLVRHHLVDLVEPHEDFSVARYMREAHAALADILARGQRPMFVGGTPMFLKAVLRGFDPGPPANWEFREAVMADVKTHGIDALHRRLRQVDPLAAHRIAPTDARRMIRALEVVYSTGTPISHRQTHFDRERSPESCNVFSICWPREQLHQRINQRVADMIQRGLVDEVRELVTKYGKLSRTARQAVGYREVLEWISSGGDLAQTTDQIAAHTRQMARRQETWLRSFGEVRPVTGGKPWNPAQLADSIEEMLI